MFLLSNLHEEHTNVSKGEKVMSGYLKKYISKYRVKADYDLRTNDFVRDEEGNLDKSFDDYYIPCASKAKIRHYQQNILFYYCPSVGRFRNILKKIYEDKIGSLEKFQTVSVSKKGEQRISFDVESMYKELVAEKVVEYIDEMEEEGEFRFKTDLMEYIANIVGAKTSGSSISPFSPKNLPNKKIDIPLENLTKYKEIIKDLEKSELLVINRIQNQFDKVIQTKKGKLYDINKERKLSCLSGKEFIYSIGLFDDYLKFLKDKVSKYQKDKNVR